jgi:hypothetical protein
MNKIAIERKLRRKSILLLTLLSIIHHMKVYNLVSKNKKSKVHLELGYNVK